MNHIEIAIAVADEEVKEILLAQLSAEGFEGFAEEEGLLKAYIPEEQFNAEVLVPIITEKGLTYAQQTVPAQNWNAVWESNFQPITVDDFVGVRADFHAPIDDVAYELVITPKMSFGTGHHATTWMMMQAMRNISFAGKTVFDFGTGTGILAILAEKLGAASVLAVDHDDWCIRNSTENLEMNGCSVVTLMRGDTANVMQQFDVVLANINRNIIEDNFDNLMADLAPGGVLLLSGLLEADEPAIMQLAAAQPLAHQQTFRRSGWIAMQYVKGA